VLLCFQPKRPLRVWGHQKTPIRLAPFFRPVVASAEKSHAISPRLIICIETTIHEQMFFWQNGINMTKS